MILLLPGPQSRAEEHPTAALWLTLLHPFPTPDSTDPLGVTVPQKWNQTGHAFISGHTDIIVFVRSPPCHVYQQFIQKTLVKRITSLLLPSNLVTRAFLLLLLLNAGVLATFSFVFSTLKGRHAENLWSSYYVWPWVDYPSSSLVTWKNMEMWLHM